QLLGACEVVAERLLEDDAGPRAIGRVLARGLDEAGRLEAADDDAVLGRWDREVVEAVSAGTPLLVEPLEVLPESDVRVRGLEAPRDVGDAALEVGPDRRV